MIKRYDLGQIRLGGQGNDTIYGPGIVERKDGDYVRYEDYAATMESIGAGGVDGRHLFKHQDHFADVSNMVAKTIDEHRAEFDEWYGSHDVRTPQHPFERHVAWLAWVKARGIRE